MSTDSNLIAEIAADGVAAVTMNRPEVHNAFDEALIAALAETFTRLGADPDVRAVVLKGAGKSFSAGGDLNWMKRTAGYSFEQNYDDASDLAAMLHALDTCPKPTVALVHGAAFGGGVGLAAACDICIAAESATFCLSEVRLGLIPSVISPYVLRAMGARAARRYFLTAERFSAADALRIGLAHVVVPAGELEKMGCVICARLLENGPAAIAASKRLIADIAGREIDTVTMDSTARGIAELRASPEGKEGVAAFLEKRTPNWRSDG